MPPTAMMSLAKICCPARTAADQAMRGGISGCIAEIASSLIGMQLHAKLLQPRRKTVSAIEIGRHVAFTRDEGRPHVASCGR